MVKKLTQLTPADSYRIVTEPRRSESCASRHSDTNDGELEAQLNVVKPSKTKM